MSIIYIIVFIISAYILSLVLKQSIELVLPAYTALWLVMLYGLAILGYAHHSFHLSLIMYFVIYAAYVLKERQLVPNKQTIRVSLLSKEHMGFLVYLVAVGIAFYCYSNHVVNVWDDFHYNATFPKNMFYYGTMPYGYQSTTGYKDYFPTQQLFFYWGFQSAKRFSEVMMFQYKLFLAYTFTLPIFNEVNSGKTVKRIMAAVIALVIPYMCLFEIYESLSMDTVLALLFANTLYGILKKEYTWFRYVYIAVMLMALVLYKSYALIFACVSIATWFFREIIALRGLEKKNKIIVAVVFLSSCVATLGCYLSWRIFCSTHGNTTYLSDILADNINNGKIVFPAYASQTIRSIIKSLWCMRLNFGSLSITVFSSVVIYLIIALFMIINQKYTKADFTSDIIILGGFAGFILFLMYTFVFIFEQWEAESLSSLDRYLGTYVLVIMFIAVGRCLSVVAEYDLIPVVFITATCVISMNYSLISRSLIPKNYSKTHSEIIETRNAVTKEIEGYGIEKLGSGAASIVLVSTEEDTLYMRSMQYECIPLHAYQFVITECENGKECERLLERADSTGAEYVYITELAEKNTDRLEMLNGLCTDNVSVDGRGLYRFDREKGLIVEKIM